MWIFYEIEIFFRYMTVYMTVLFIDMSLKWCVIKYHSLLNTY